VVLLTVARVDRRMHAGTGLQVESGEGELS
jgi:hypothetical protein